MDQFLERSDLLKHTTRNNLNNLIPIKESESVIDISKHKAARLKQIHE